MSSSDPLLDIRGLKKHFGGQRALDGVDFELRRGEIHALLGENGAGKSTLIKILAGVHSADEGEIRIDGSAVPPYTASTASDLGLAFVHQDLGLIDTLSVAENLALEIGYDRRYGLVSHRRTEAAMRQTLARVGSDVSPGTLVGELRRHEKVLVALARALSLDARIIVFDEVSSSLPAPEVDRLMEPLRASLRDGVGYVYVTHRLPEVFDLADRVTVLRDGRRVATADVAEIDHDRVVDWILGGRNLGALDGDTHQVAADAEPRLRVRGLAGPGLVAPVDVDVVRGEILAICGLVGSGARELARLIGGAAPAEAGTVTLDGAELPLNSRHRLSAMGCEYVAGDRIKEGAILDLTVRENFFPTYRRRGAAEDRLVRRPGREREATKTLIERFNVRPAGSAERPLATLSGGNQQKVAFGRALRTVPRLLVLDDPTQGVDVGSRKDLHDLLREAADNGTVIVFASTDFEEVVNAADRALVMCEGELWGEFSGDRLTEQSLAEASYGTAPAAAAKEG